MSESKGFAAALNHSETVTFGLSNCICALCAQPHLRLLETAVQGVTLCPALVQQALQLTQPPCITLRWPWLPLVGIQRRLHQQVKTTQEHSLLRPACPQTHSALHWHMEPVESHAQPACCTSRLSCSGVLLTLTCIRHVCCAAQAYPQASLAVRGELLVTELLVTELLVLAVPHSQALASLPHSSHCLGLCTHPELLNGTGLLVMQLPSQLLQLHAVTSCPRSGACPGVLQVLLQELQVGSSGCQLVLQVCNGASGHLLHLQGRMPLFSIFCLRQANLAATDLRRWQPVWPAGQQWCSWLLSAPPQAV